MLDGRIRADDNAAVRVELTWFEAFRAAEAGVMRHIEALKRKRPQTYGSVNKPWDIDIESAAAEMAVAKGLGVYWTAVAGRPENLPGDCGQYQVRSTTRENGCLILHDRDADDDVFVLVTGQVPMFTLRGWIRGAEGKNPLYLSPGDGRPAYFVPQHALMTLESLGGHDEW